MLYLFVETQRTQWFFQQLDETEFINFMENHNKIATRNTNQICYIYWWSVLEIDQKKYCNDFKVANRICTFFATFIFVTLSIKSEATT